jgi:hypothetical protein
MNSKTFIKMCQTHQLFCTKRSQNLRKNSSGFLISHFDQIYYSHYIHLRFMQISALSVESLERMIHNGTVKEYLTGRNKRCKQAVFLSFNFQLIIKLI